MYAILGHPARFITPARQRQLDAEEAARPPTQAEIEHLAREAARLKEIDRLLNGATEEVCVRLVSPLLHPKGPDVPDRPAAHHLTHL